jgi:hypothetical protein
MNTTANKGFISKMDGQVRKAVTRKHTAKDVNREFKDNFGRTYTYTFNGLIY